MEIFFIGFIIVALMVYASTKIKRSAAEAFEREEIDRDDFRITKPEGFINPIREDSAFAFEAYSNDLGEKSERNIWKAQVYLTVSDGLNLDSVSSAARREADAILSEKVSGVETDGERAVLLESERTEKNVAYHEFRKILESPGREKTYDLKISILESFRDEFAERTSEMLASFEVK